VGSHVARLSQVVTRGMRVGLQPVAHGLPTGIVRPGCVKSHRGAS